MVKKIVKEEKHHSHQNGKEKTKKKHEKNTITQSHSPPAQLLSFIYIFLDKYGYNEAALQMKKVYIERHESKSLDSSSEDILSTHCPSVLSSYVSWEEDQMNYSKNNNYGSTNAFKKDKFDVFADGSSEHLANTNKSNISISSMSSRGSSPLTPSTSSGSSNPDVPETIPGLGLLSTETSTSSSSSSSCSSSSYSEIEKIVPSTLRKKKKAAKQPLLESISSTETSSSDISEDSESTDVSSSEPEGNDSSSSSSDSSASPDVDGSRSGTSSISSSSSSSQEDSSLEDERTENQRKASRKAKSKAVLPEETKARKISDTNLEANTKMGKASVKPVKKESIEKEPMVQQRKNSTDSSTTLLGGEGQSLADSTASNGLAAGTTFKPYAENGDKMNGKRKRKDPPEGSSSEGRVAPGVSKQARKESSPFSRIPKNLHVQEQFKAENLYVPNSYNEQAYSDLRLTKGKGFTKEKNKKKRSARFSSGKIDIGGREPVKF